MRSKLRELLERSDEFLVRDWEDIYNTVRDAAIGGDMSAARLLFERGWPVRKGRPCAVQIPTIRGLDDAREAVAVISTALGEGTVTLEEAKALADIVAQAKSVLEESEAEKLAVELAAIREKLSRGPRLVA